MSREKSDVEVASLPASNDDVEKGRFHDSSGEGVNNRPVKRWKGKNLTENVKWLLTASGIEKRGVIPVPREERTCSQYVNIFTLWFCMNSHILPLTFGMLGPVYGLDLRDCALVILFFNLLTALAPAYLSIIGPKTGMRQMIQSRFSFGRYLVCVPVLLNIATLVAFCVIIVDVGGFTLSSVTDGHMTAAVGIVIVALFALFISFCGFTVLHLYERYAWIPALIGIIIMTGCGGSHLHEQAPTDPTTSRGVLSFGMIVASYTIPWAGMASDFTPYYRPEVSSWKVFAYVYTGLVIPTVLLMTLGAAIMGAVPSVPSWSDGYDSLSTGGVIAAMLSPAGGFGKFVVVVLSLSMLGNLSATMYSITLNFQMVIPQLSLIPRYYFAIVVTAIVIPVGVVAATNFFESLEAFVGIIAYWSAEWAAIVITEHVVFRKRDCSTYDHACWDNVSKLPIGVAAITAPVLTFGLIVPCMDQVWYVGPIAERIGDIGFEVGFFLSALLYIPFRSMEKRFVGR